MSQFEIDIQAQFAQLVKELEPETSEQSNFDSPSSLGFSREPQVLPDLPDEDEIYFPAPYERERLSEEEEALPDFDYFLNPPDIERTGFFARKTVELPPRSEKLKNLTCALGGAAVGIWAITGALYVHEASKTPDHTTYVVPSHSDNVQSPQIQPSHNFSPVDIAVYNKYLDK